ncbi:MAG: acyl-CoA thioesterase, partial [Candidatus Krumholzibacteriota bacterium]|nr:acyl-CoA thioesterase [Candidatus Krumholzibacteriota bacterium]
MVTAGPLLFRLAPPPVKGLTLMASRRYAVIGIATTVGTVILTFSAVEVALRAAGFRYELRVHVIESTAPEAEDVRKGFSVDRQLIWVDNGYYARLSEARSRRIDIVYLGDSCTQFGAYDRIFAGLVEKETGSAVSSVKLGVAGWTTHQGLRQMERDVVSLRPCVVTICYGWNDHWLSIGLSDREIERINRSALGRIQSLRIGQLLLESYVALVRDKDHPVIRVSEEEFRENLIAMIDAAQGVGAVPVLMTAPSSHRPGHEPAYLAGRWVARLSDLVPLHRRYVAIVRRVAAEKGVLLCDLAARFDSIASPDARDACFFRDGIHYTGEGNARTARWLFECFRNDPSADVCFVDAER